jgi:hypothetical protein
MKLEPIDTSTTAGKRQVMDAWDNNRPVALQRYKEGEYQLLPTDCEPAWDWPENNYGIVVEQYGPDEVWIQQRDGALWAYPEDREGSVRYVRADE